MLLDIIGYTFCREAVCRWKIIEEVPNCTRLLSMYWRSWCKRHRRKWITLSTNPSCLWPFPPESPGFCSQMVTLFSKPFLNKGNVKPLCLSSKCDVLLAFRDIESFLLGDTQLQCIHFDLFCSCLVPRGGKSDNTCKHFVLIEHRVVERRRIFLQLRIDPRSVTSNIVQYNHV